MSSSETAPPTRGTLAGVGLVLAAAIGFSAKAVLVKLAYRYRVDAPTLLALRMMLSAPAFLAAALWGRSTRETTPLERRDWVQIGALGVVGFYLASILDFLGLEHITAGLERLILFLYPTLVVLLSALLFRRPLRGREILALLLSYAGIGVVFLHDVSLAGSGVALGAALVFGSALAYASYLMGSGHAIARVGARRFTAYAMTAACGASILQFAATHPLSALRLPLPVYGLGLAMAVFSTVLPAFLMSAGIRRIGAGRAALIGAVGPVSTLLLAYVFLGEPLGPLQLQGAALVLTGVLIVSL